MSSAACLIPSIRVERVGSSDQESPGESGAIALRGLLVVAKGETIKSDWYDLPHVARFLLMGIYTGTRPGRDLHRLDPCRRQSKLGRSGERHLLPTGAWRGHHDEAAAARPQAESAPRPYPPLEGEGLDHQPSRRVGRPAVQSIKYGLKRALEVAGIDKPVTPHTLRHTAATWMMQNAVPIWEAAGYLGMSEKMLREVYGHHHPDFHQNAVDDLTCKPRTRQ